MNNKGKSFNKIKSNRIPSVEDDGVIVEDNFIIIGRDSGITLDKVNSFNTIMIGRFCEPSQSDATNEFSIGGSSSSGYGISRYFFGNGGKPDPSPGGVTFSPTSAFGTDIPGAPFYLYGGASTGKADGGEVVIGTTKKNASSDILNPINPVASFDANGNIRAWYLHNNDTPQGNFTQQDIRSGTYTPTIANMANLTGTPTPSVFKWLRLGNVCMVSGRVSGVDPVSAATATSFTMSLPVTSFVNSAELVSGTAFCGTIASMGAEIIADTVNLVAKMIWISSDITSKTWSVMFSFEVLDPP